MKLVKKLRKKVLNINGVLFNIFTEDVEEVERYFSNFVTACNEKVVATYNIYFDRDKDILDALVNSFNKKEAIVIPTFKNQTHLKNGSQYLIDTEEYMCIKTNDNNYKLFGTIKGLSWIVRELLIREMEDKGYFYMHGTGIEVFDKGILLLGNSGSGKTTFMTKLSELDTKERFISNDRVFVKNRMMHYYPLPIIYAMGTARANRNLDQYFRRTHALEKRRGKDYKTCSDGAKCDVPLKDVPKIFPNIENIDKSKIDLIIFPRITDTERYSYLGKEEAIRRLNETNFTPNDRENERREWLRHRVVSIEEIERRKQELNEDLITHIPIIEVEYTKDTSSTYLGKVLRKTLW